MKKLLVTAKAAAIALSLPLGTIHEMMSDGRLEWIPIGRARRIPVKALERIAKGEDIKSEGMSLSLWLAADIENHSRRAIL